MPWEAFLQLSIGAVFVVSLGVGVLMYLDGYWTEERTLRRRKK